MIEYEYIPIEKEAIPYRFEMTISEKTFTFEINYNAEHDFFTVDLYRNGELMLCGEKIVYGKVLFNGSSYYDIPDVPIVPYDLARNVTRVTWDNLNETVFLWLVKQID